MTAQIRPNRMEVNDRFPMLGFAVRADEPNIDAEVVLASDVTLFQPQNRASRTAANFYSSREHGVLSVPRGEGVFVVPPDVLARFIGTEKLFFGLATGHAGNGGLHVDAVPRDGSPYVSLRGFTGRTLRRSFGAGRPPGPPVLEWTGDAARPGSEPSNGAAPRNGNGGAASAASPNGGAVATNGTNGGARVEGGPASGTAPAADYDDGFGPMPDIPAREAGWRPGARTAMARGVYGRQMDGGLTADAALQWIRSRTEQVVNVVGSDVSPPYVHRLGAGSGTLRTAWQAALAPVGFVSPLFALLAALPELADRAGVTLSVGPALDTPVFGGGVGVVFEPGGEAAVFGMGEISADFAGLSDFIGSLKLALQAKLKLGYNRGGIAAFANLAKVAALAVGEELVVGAEVWLDRDGNGIGGAVSIGVGFALQLAEEMQPAAARPRPTADARQRAERIGGQFAPRVAEALDLGLDPRAVLPLLDTLDPPSATQAMARYARAKADDETPMMPPPPAPRARAMDGGVAAAIAIGGFVVESIRDSQGDVTWELDQFRGIKHPNDTAPANPGPFRDGATIRLDDWPTSGGLLDDISAWFAIDWQYNGTSLGNVRITNIGTNDAVGWGLHVRAQIMDDNQVYPPSNCAALRLTLHYRFNRSIGSDVIAIRQVTLYGDGTWQTDGHWVQAEALGTASGQRRTAHA